MATDRLHQGLTALVGELLPLEDKARARLCAHLREFLEVANGAFAANPVSAACSLSHSLNRRLATLDRLAPRHKHR